jgi:hypothetical protein
VGSPKRVDGNQGDLFAAWRSVGCVVLDLHEVGRGAPDCLVVDPTGDNLFLVEIKVPGRNLNTREALWHATWPGKVYVVHNTEEALAMVGIKESR